MMSNDWKRCMLGDILTLQRGFDLPERTRQKGSVPIVSSSGISAYHSTAKVSSPGVVTGRYGTLGEVFYIEEDFWPLNTTLYVRDFKGNDPRFLSYFLRTLNLEQQNTAGAVPGLNRNALHLLPVSIPPTPTQRKIAAILSAYDDLIENNTRRIAILEEMAQSLYREWFVHFRFPGYEKKSMVESALGMIPEGWEVKAFSEVAEFVNGFAFEPRHWGKVGKPIIKIAELKNGIAGKTPFYDGNSIPEKYHIRNGDLLFSWSADLDAYIWSGGSAFLNQHLFNVVPRSSFTKPFLFYALKDRMWEFRNRSQGTTMRHIKRSALDEVMFSVPLIEEQDSFVGYAEPMILEIINLSEKNANLRRTRDLLLPKLISGVVDVEGLEIAGVAGG
jgi:type I restriction enzyme, S subunit